MNQTFEQIKNDHRIYIGSEYEERIDYRVADLIQDRVALRELLKRQEKGIEAPSFSLAGLLFGKMYSVLAMGFFEMMVVHGVILDLDPARVGIECEEKNRMNYIVPAEAALPMDEVSDEKKKELVRTFIIDHVQPLFQNVAQTSRCKSTHMRSIVSHNLHQRYCALLKERPEEKETIDQLFRWLTSNELFRENYRNPLQFKFRYYTSDAGKETYVRRHCCMKYMLHDANKAKCCATCPLIADEERDEKL
ncbi:hypothetical protein [Halobacillus salinus]|uniref:Aerobactin siderophore biosynthesis IucA/IucC-like C-terminal domain-containing protein n=1 Tax=Halobacillus salinus TaxID=192814 RepID=A0A4Z0H1H7_9BACI|nr:hypothetical protein [Halobacillus salinus]TGB02907.1 hypothetical protein E4663_12210 [Halobacillus salinus]